jgi:SDR family mycofactocin-dependent oxidoreductase
VNTGVAIVTGAARGIGAATVSRLAADGWAVIAIDRVSDDPRLPYSMGTPAELAAVVLNTGSERVVACQGDVGDPCVLAEAVAIAETRFGGLDAMLAVAGVIAGGVPLWEMPEEQLDAVLEIDLRSVIVAARVAIPALLRRPQPRRGRFIAVASAAATSGLPLLAAYCAAKAGVTGLVRALAAELGDSGITANAVSPGSTDTPILAESARLYGLPSSQNFAGQQPVGRLLDPQEIAAVLAFLAGPDSSAITGAIVAADGGLAL